jgi:DNA modification methylase
MAKRLRIVSPKRNKRLQTGWEGFFPYYAGYPELFARELLKSARLPHGAVVLDPWNGSGTTTYIATSLGLDSIGIDLNPVMIIVARARLLPPSEADHLPPWPRRSCRTPIPRHRR